MINEINEPYSSLILLGKCFINNNGHDLCKYIVCQYLPSQVSKLFSEKKSVKKYMIFFA